LTYYGITTTDDAVITETPTSTPSAGGWGWGGGKR
jgi:hypothetical protein